MGLVKNAGEPIIGWPAPNNDDVILVGKIVLLFSYIDFNLRRMIEVLDHASKLPKKWAGKSSKLHLSEIETILADMPETSASNAFALRRIKEFRKLRNMLAHFAIKRFPSEDALVFITKDSADYKKVLGSQPDPGMVMTAVADLVQVRAICSELDRIQHWLSAATNDIENAFLKKRSE